MNAVPSSAPPPVEQRAAGGSGGGARGPTLVTSRGLDGFAAQVKRDPFLLRTDEAKILPLNSIAHSPYIFEFNNTDNPRMFFDLGRSELRGRFRVVRTDGRPIGPKDKITTAQFPSVSLFSRQDLSLNDVIISDAASSHTFAPKNFFQTSLAYGETAKKSVLPNTLLYCEETIETVDSLNPVEPEGGAEAAKSKKKSKVSGGSEGVEGSSAGSASGEPSASTVSTAAEVVPAKDMYNPVLGMRKKAWACNKDVLFTRAVMEDFATTSDKYIPARVKVSLKLFRAPASYTLISPDAADDEYDIQLKELYLVVKRLFVTDVFAEEYNRRRLSVELRFPFVSTGVRIHHVPSGIRQFCLRNVCQSVKRPMFVMLVLQKADQFFPAFNANHFIYQSEGLVQAQLLMDGHPVQAWADPLDYSDDSVNGLLPAYTAFLRSSQHFYADSNFNVDYGSFVKMLFNAGWNLTNEVYSEGSGSNITLYNTEPVGMFDLNMTFEDLLPSNLIAMVFVTSYKSVHIDSQDRVSVSELGLDGK